MNTQAPACRIVHAPSLSDASPRSDRLWCGGRESNFLAVLVLAVVACGAACGLGDDCGPAITGPVPAPQLVDGPLGAANAVPVRLFLTERAAQPDRTLWIGVVPGTSEQWGHHKAPSAAIEAQGVLISDEYAARLDRAFALLDAGVVRFLLVTGGTIDPNRPDYNESARGKAYLVTCFGAAWTDGALADRILVDPLAERSTTNLRNADRVTVGLGLNCNLVITTMPARSNLTVEDYFTQGFYFLYHEASTYDARCKRDFGYALGEFSLHETVTCAGDRITALLHCRFPIDSLNADTYEK